MDANPMKRARNLHADGSHWHLPPIVCGRRANLPLNSFQGRVAGDPGPVEGTRRDLVSVLTPWHSGVEA